MKSLVILLTIFKMLFYISAQSTCKKVNSCKCKFDNGQVIDLKPVAKSSGAAYVDVLDSGGVDQFSWNPCTSFSERECTDAAVCQTHAGALYNCGTQDSAVFGYDETNKVYTITYQADTITQSNSLRVTTLLLYCDQGPDVFEPVGETGDATYVITEDESEDNELQPVVCVKREANIPEEKKYAYPVDMIHPPFFTLIPVYLIGGVLFQIFIRKNSGRKVIPNYSFWVGLPGLIKDGALFIFRRGGRKGTYNSI